ncbi:F-box/kelch-repeat protein At5g15710 [Physcomitrium patens]|uniref:F-box domain-containing protein n=1 Tax=Physcomitrium patens TaxID=3218 RepID=A9T2V8_PHYPA|nr:F-box/kelch-repeat protein At5g15710-like [Physcomitrium patens]PNR58059.1 hypothetical protein PHYPA_005054 [Physcomitrium patens]|eukprot:XP_024370366.1 F-box/kelch-repeat protein At5g15710-like [Physcomitrella patens]
MTEELEESLWSRMPADIRELVLQRLPLEVLYRFRAVCKHWRALPLSPEFCRSVTHPQSKHSYLLGIQPIGLLQTCPIYNPIAKSLSWIDLGFLESRFERFTFERWVNDDDPWGSSEFRGASSDGGLLCVCVRIHESEQDAIFVCNPLTRACNLLPLIEGNTWGMCLGLSIRVENYGHYRVFATKHGKVGNKFEQRLYTYDSVSASWKVVPKCTRFPHDSISGAFCKGIYYALYLEGSHELVLMSYDTDHDAWVDTGVVVPCTSNSRAKLVVSNDRLFCVSYFHQNEHNLYVTISEVNLHTTMVLGISVSEIELPDQSQLFVHSNWDVLGYRNSLIFHTRSVAAFVFDFTTDLPEWRPMNLEPLGNSRSHILLVALTFDLRAAVE